MGDRRDTARSAWPGFDQERMLMTVEVDEMQHALPAELVVCDLCQGRGHYVNPSIDAHGISPEEFSEDPDFAEAYLSGGYDVTCEQCGGRRVVPEVLEPPKGSNARAVYEQWREEQEDRAREEAADRRTMMMEMGYGYG